MKRTIIILTGVCLVLAIATGIILAVTGRPSGKQPDFVPPEFDLNAVAEAPKAEFTITITGTPSAPVTKVATATVSFAAANS